MNDNRVQICGIGVISPLGQKVQDFLDNLNSFHKLENQGNADTSKYFAPGEVQNFSLSKYYDEKLIHRLDRASEFACAAAKQALLDSNVDLDQFSHDSKGVSLGISNSIATAMSDFDESVLVRGPRRCDIGVFPNAVMCAPASRIAIFEHIQGSNTTFSSGRNSSLDAIGFSFLQIKYEGKKVIVAGGTEALSQKIMKWFESERYLFKADQSRKTDRFIPAEGACVVVLSAESGSDRGYGEITAFNSTFAPFRKGNKRARIQSLVENIAISLSDAQLEPLGIDAVLISSYYDPIDREVEIEALDRIFSPNTTKPFFEFKKATKETFSSFGALQVACAAGLLKGCFTSETLNYFNCNSDSIMPENIKTVLIISLDPSGHMGSMVISLA